MDNQWKVFWNLNASYYKEKEQVAKNLKNVLGISDFLAKLLVSRNIEIPEKADIFLNHPEKETYDPFLMNDMDKAINILMDAKRKKEKVAIFGDYDVDGVTSSSILYLGMKKLGFDVITYIPSRIEEGYSLNEKAISELKNKGYNILVTVDCGTTSIKEIEHAKSLGMKVIVTDHHLPKDKLPKSDAILNPKREDNKYPFKDLAGVGVAFKLLQALFMTNDKSLNPFEYIDLVAIGTIADIVPILSENRYFVKKGLEKIKENPSKGVSMLLNELKIVDSEINSRTIAYKVAPKINAAGRMANAYAAFKLLTIEEDEKIKKAVSDLLKLNSKRQNTEKEIYLYALSQIDLNPEFHGDPVLVLSGENWHLGVLGIVASKLTDQYNKPVLMISKNKEICKGSARSPQGIDLIELLQKIDENNILQDFGGHKLAAGFSLFSKDIDNLRKTANNAYKELYGDKHLSYSIDVDMEIDKIFPSMFEDVERLEPFGYMNPEPVFLIKDAKLENLRLFGNGSQNFSGILKKDNSLVIDVLGYDLGQKLLELNHDEKKEFFLDGIGTLRIENSYNLKNSYVKFYFHDLKIKGETVDEKINETLLVTKILREELNKISQIEVIDDNLSKDNVAMFLPSKIKNDSILKKIYISLSNKKKVIIISGTKSLLDHSYKIVSTYFPENIIFYNKENFKDEDLLLKYEIFFLTVSQFIKNQTFFESITSEIILDEPFYSLYHPITKKLKEYVEFRKYVLQRKNISVFSSLYNENLKELLKRYGYKILISSSNNNNFEIIKENNNVIELLKEFVPEKSSRVLILNDPKRQRSLIKLLDKKLSIDENSIKVFNHSMNFREKTIAREKFKRDLAYFYITSFSNNGIAWETRNFPPTLLIFDVPKTVVELLDLTSNPIARNQKITIIFGYDKRFKIRMLYEHSRRYPSLKVLKKTYDFIKFKSANNFQEISENLFKNDEELTNTVLNILEEGELIKRSNSSIELIDSFDIKKLQETSNFKDRILDSWILKNAIDFYENLDTRKLINFLKGSNSKVGIRGV